MTREETKKIMDILSVAYPAFYRNTTQDTMRKAVILWHEMFADDDFGAVAAAVKALIATKADSYPPSIGEVKEQMTSLKMPDMDESTAWALVAKACTNGIYHYREEYAKLPTDVQAAVGAPEQIREWAKMDSETFHSVVASNFKRNFRANIARKKTNEMLPTDIKTLIGGLSANLMIGE